MIVRHNPDRVANNVIPDPRVLATLQPWALFHNRFAVGMVILSDEYFQQRFGGDRSIIGKTLPVAAGGGNGPAPIVVGVVAPGFELLFPPKANIEQFPSLWIAGRIPYDVANRNNVQWRVIGRLKPGASIMQAQAETDAIVEKIKDENTIAKTAGQHFQLVPMGIGSVTSILTLQ